MTRMTQTQKTSRRMPIRHPRNRAADHRPLPAKISRRRFSIMGWASSRRAISWSMRSKRERFFAQLREWRDAAAGASTSSATTRARSSGCAICCRRSKPIRSTSPSARSRAASPFPPAKVAVLSDAELFGRYRNTRARRLALRRARDQASRAQIDFSELNEDDFVVHLEHGIGRYEGMKSHPARRRRRREEVLVVAFADDARLYVPLEQSFLISRYVGVGKKNPPLSTLGDGKWAKAKKNAEKAVFDYAAKLLADARRARDGAGLRLSAGQQVAARIRGVVPFQGNAGPDHAPSPRPSGHGDRAADGPADLRRCRLRQNRGRHPRRVQGGDGREASGHPRADDGARAAALPALSASACADYPITRRAAQRASARRASSARRVRGLARRRAWTSSSARTG